jgi:NADPH:quinone reductase-like Zn-dependent oxidoreductase
MRGIIRVKCDADPNLALAFRSDLPTPHIAAANDVRVRIVCAAGNPADDKLNRGMIPFVSLNKVIGSDVAGVVDEVGASVTRLRVGDRVFGCTGLSVSGAFAEYVVGNEKLFAPIPAGVSFADAAAVPLAGMTALEAAAYLKAGDTVVVCGASGGVGSFLVQIARARGAQHVIAISSDVALCQRLGAHETVNYKLQPGWPQVLAGRNVDLFIDCVGGDQVWVDAQRVIKPNGHFVTVAGDFDKGLSVSGLFVLLGQAIYRWFAYRLSTAPSYQLIFSSETLEKLQELETLMSENKLHAAIDAVSPFQLTKEGAVAMMNRLHSKAAHGKLIFQIGQE